MERIEKLAELVKDIKFAMLTTVEADGALVSRPMTTLKHKFDGQLWFFTALDSGKSAEVQREHQVNVSYADPSGNRYVSMSGTAQVIKDRAKAEELWSPLVKAFFPKGLDDPELALLKVDVHKAEYWDAPSAKLVQAFGLAKAIVTGQPYTGEASDHQKVTV